MCPSYPMKFGHIKWTTNEYQVHIFLPSSIYRYQYSQHVQNACNLTCYFTVTVVARGAMSKYLCLVSIAACYLDLQSTRGTTYKNNRLSLIICYPGRQLLARMVCIVICNSGFVVCMFFKQKIFKMKSKVYINIQYVTRPRKRWLDDLDAYEAE